LPRRCRAASISVKVRRVCCLANQLRVGQSASDDLRRRDAEGHTPRNLAEALIVEAGELLQCFLWDGAFGKPRGNPTEELADVLIYALNLASALGVDPEAIIRDKIAANAVKYPPVVSA